MPLPLPMRVGPDDVRASGTRNGVAAQLGWCGPLQQLRRRRRWAEAHPRYIT